MATPTPLLIFFLYKRYRKKFTNNPNNLGKKPKGGLFWYFTFLLKLIGVAIIASIIIRIIDLLISLFSNL